MLSSIELVAVRGIGLAVRRAPGEGVPIMMIHGLTDSGACFGRLAAHLAPNRDVIALDLRGHGLSDAPESGYTSEDHAADVLGVLEALRLSMVTLLGHSLGGDTALHAAVLRPDLFQQVILEDPPWAESWTPGRPPELEKKYGEWRRHIERFQAMSYEQVLACGRADSPHWVDEELQPWARSKLQVSIDALSYITTVRPSWQSMVRELKCPTLLVTGDTNRGGIVSEAIAEQARSLSPAVEVSHLAGAGHSIRRDRFEAYVDGVRRFVGLSRGG
jgi:pimeloyl-ACP methyl ester carboxylesterase